MYTQDTAMAEFATTDTPLDDYPPEPDFPPQIIWRGLSGTEYEYSACYLEMEGEFFPGPVNFVIAREVQPNKFEPLYIGETDHLDRVLDDHHLMRALQWNKATHVCVHVSSDNVGVRLAEKKDLVEYWDPPRNR